MLLRWPNKRPATPAIRTASFNSGEQAELFRRSRTLTGSASSVVVAAGPSASHLVSPRVRAHQLRGHRRLLTTGLLLALVAAGVMTWLLDQAVVGVTVATRQFVRQVDTARYQKLVADYLDARPAERFRFALNVERFQAELQREAPELSSAQLSGSRGLATTTLLLQYRRPVAAWEAGSSRSYVDSEGVIFGRNLFAEPRIVITDDSGLVGADGSLIASQRLLGFIGKVAGSLAQKGIAIESASIPKGALRELDIKVDGRAYPLKTHIDRDPTGQAADIVSMLGYLDKKGIVPQYVDLRVVGKAYYQ